MVNVSFNGPGSKQGYADPPPPLRNDQIFMKDAQCVETNEKSILRYLFLELWLILLTVFKCVCS